MRVVIDVNVLMSGLMRGRTQAMMARLLADVRDGRHTILVCPQLKAEILTTMAKPRLAPLLQADLADHLFDLLDLLGEWHVLHEIPNLCRDPKDNYLLALAQEGNADVLLTGDRDLLVLHPLGTLRILSPAQWEELLS